MDIDPSTIRSLRQFYGFSQSAAASLVHKTRLTWANWESGKYAMPPALWAAFCERLPDSPEKRSDIVRQFRLEMKLSRSLAARALGVTREQWQEWETGRAQIPEETLDKLMAPMPSPMPVEVHLARLRAGLTVKKAAADVGASMLAWRRWETGRESMPGVIWLLVRDFPPGVGVPTWRDIVAVRQYLRLGHQQAAKVTGTQDRLGMWRHWENGREIMPAAIWSNLLDVLVPHNPPSA